MHQQHGKETVGNCKDKAELIGSWCRQGSCTNTLHKNADTLLNRGNNATNQFKADDRNTTIGTTVFGDKGDIQGENGIHKKHPDTEDQTTNATTEETGEEQRTGAICRPKKRVMFDVDSSTASSSEFVDSSLTSVSSLESDATTKSYPASVSVSSRSGHVSLITSTIETTTNSRSTTTNVTVTLGWKGLKQSNAITDTNTTTIGSLQEPMVNNTIRTTQENINVSNQHIKRNKPLYRINNNFYTVNQVDKSHKDNTEESDKTLTEGFRSKKSNFENLKPLPNEGLTSEQLQSNPTVTCQGPYTPLRRLVGHSDINSNKPSPVNDERLVYKSQVSSGESIRGITKEAGRSGTQLDIGNECKRIRSVIHSNCVNPEDNTILATDRMKNKDIQGHTKVLPHSSYRTGVNVTEVRGNNSPQDVNVHYANRNIERESSPLLTKDSTNKEQLSLVKVGGQREDTSEFNLYNRQYLCQCSDSLHSQVGENIDGNATEDLRHNNTDFETTRLDFNLEQLEENIEAEFEALNSKMNEFDIEERGTSLLTSPRRVARSRHLSGSDSDGTDGQIKMERHLEGKWKVEILVNPVPVKSYIIMMVRTVAGREILLFKNSKC